MGRSVAAGGPAPGSDWHAELRARGYRLTPQRQLVLESVGALGHATPEEIVTSVRQTASGVNISTVYRTLELLEELGLVQHTHLGHGAPTYSVATDDDHVHLVCRDCGAVDEAPPQLLSDVVSRLAAERGFTVDVGHFAVFGRCRSCAGDIGTTEEPGPGSGPAATSAGAGRHPDQTQRVDGVAVQQRQGVRAEPADVGELGGP